MACLGFALLGLSVSGSEFLHHAEERLGVPILYALRGPILAPSDIVIVTIDPLTADALGLPRSIARWPRSVHACLLDRHLRNARFVAFDINFVGPSAPAEDTDAALAGSASAVSFRDACAAALSAFDPDAELAAAMARHGQVFLVQPYGEPRDTRPGGASATCADGTPTVLRGSSRVADQRGAALTALNPRLASSARGWAPFGLPAEGRPVSWFWTFLSELAHLPTLPSLLVALGHAAEPLELPQTTTTSPVSSAGAEVSPPARYVAARRGAALARRAAPGAETVAQDEAVGGLRGDLLTGSNCRHFVFYGPPHEVFETHSYQSLLGASSGTAPRLDARGKAVFVGYSAPLVATGSDRFATNHHLGTPFYSGVELLATAYANIREQQFVVRAPWFAGIGALVGLTLAPLCWLCRPRAFAMGVSLHAVALVALVSYAFSTAGLWLPFVAPLLVLLPIAGLVWRLRMRRAAGLQRAAAARALDKHFPQGVQTMIAQGALARGAHRLTRGLCIATDARQFSTHASQLAPAAVARLLDDYYDILIPAVLDHGGLVIDAAGDGLLCVVPVDDAARADRALRLARDLLAGAARFDAAHPRTPLSLRLGISAGEFSLGVIGSETRQFFKAVGASINLAARLEALAKLLGARCIIDGSLAPTDASTLTGLRPCGRFMLRGAEAPSEVLEVGAGDQAAPAPALAAAVAQFQRGEWLAAAQAFEQLAAAHPDDGVVAFYRAFIQRGGGRAPRGFAGYVDLSVD